MELIYITIMNRKSDMSGAHSVYVSPLLELFTVDWESSLMATSFLPTYEGTGNQTEGYEVVNQVGDLWM